MKFVTMEDADLVIIGAGINGLANAKTYLEIHPDASVVILEAESIIGGIWAENKLYAESKWDSMLGTYEFSDFPIDSKTFSSQLDQPIPSLTMHDYLKAFATHFNFYSKIRFSSRVESLEKVHDGWVVMVDGLEQTKSKIVADKVIVATGVTSEPFISKVEGSKIFGELLLHGGDLKECEELTKTKGKVVVFGGSKGAWDVAYAFADKGVEVEWIISESEQGQYWMSSRLELLMQTRFLTWFSPCIWGDADGYTRTRHFLHTTWFGRLIVSIFWFIFNQNVKSFHQYSSNSSTANLKSWNNSFWIASSLNYPARISNLLCSGKIKVHIADIDSLSPRKVKLSDGTEIEAEALIDCNRKYNPPLTFLPKGIETSLGLTHLPPADLPPTLEPTLKMLHMADTEILTRFPRLATAPKPKLKPKVINKKDGIVPESTDFFPHLLTRFMVPPVMNNAEDHTLAFAGFLTTPSPSTFTTLVAQIQALWISSYLTSGFPPVRTKTTQTTFAHGMTDRLYETLLHNRFGKWRYPNPNLNRHEGGKGGGFPELGFDVLPYVDLLLSDLGLERFRKGGAVNEAFGRVSGEDYRGVVLEWVEKEREREEVLERAELEERGRSNGKEKSKKDT